jgi:hypothetical protein
MLQIKFRKCFTLQLEGHRTARPELSNALAIRVGRQKDYAKHFQSHPEQWPEKGFDFVLLRA